MPSIVQSFALQAPGARRAAAAFLAAAPDNMLVDFSRATRTNLQNRLAHAIWTDLEVGATWARIDRDTGEVTQQRLSKLQWKALMVSAHSVATGRPSELVQGIEGEWVDIRESTARMPIARMSSVIEYTLAWMAANGVPTRMSDRVQKEHRK